MWGTQMRPNQLEYHLKVHLGKELIAHKEICVKRYSQRKP